MDSVGGFCTLTDEVDEEKLAIFGEISLAGPLMVWQLISALTGFVWVKLSIVVCRVSFMGSVCVLEVE